MHLIIIDDLTIVAFNFSSLIYFIDISFYMLMFFQFDTFSSFLRHTSIYDVTKIIAATTLSLIGILLFISVYNFILNNNIDYSLVKYLISQYFILRILCFLLCTYNTICVSFVSRFKVFFIFVYIHYNIIV